MAARNSGDFVKRRFSTQAYSLEKYLDDIPVDNLTQQFGFSGLR